MAIQTNFGVRFTSAGRLDRHGFVLLRSAAGRRADDGLEFVCRAGLELSGAGSGATNVAQTNYTAAKTNLATYLRARTNVNWFFDPHAVTNTVSYSQSSADQTTNGYVNSIGIGYTFPNGVINWYYNATTESG